MSLSQALNQFAQNLGRYLYEMPFCFFFMLFSLSYQGSFNRSKLVVNFFCIFIHIA